jgi:hypothetical protein
LKSPTTRSSERKNDSTPRTRTRISPASPTKRQSATTDYITTEELRSYIGDDTTLNEDVIQSACTVASRAVEAICDRVFTDAGSVSARYFAPSDQYHCPVDDFNTVTGLIVATDDTYDGTFATTWTINTHFVTQPRNARRGPLAWPFDTLESTGSTYLFPLPVRGRNETVKVTARWGWTAAPDLIVQATYVAAAEIFKLKDAPFGHIGFDPSGFAMRIRENPKVKELLRPYMKAPVAVA